MRKKRENVEVSCDGSLIRRGKYKKKNSSIKKNSILEYHKDKMNSYKKDNVTITVKKITNEIELKTRLIEELLKHKGTKVYPMIINNDIQLVPQSHLKIQSTYQPLMLRQAIKKEYDNEAWVDLKVYNLERELTKLEEKIKEIKNPDNVANYLLDSNVLIQSYIKLENEELELLNDNDRTEEETKNLNRIIEQKNNLSNEYLKKFFPDKINLTIKFIDTLTCKHCNVQYIDNVCENCGMCSNNLDIPEDMSYKELQEYDKKPQFTYEKASHLSDWLRRFTASEGKVIPQEILDKVIMEAHKERFSDLAQLSESQVKKYLKKLNLNDYYENVISIINRINKRPPFTLPLELEEKIKIMFSQIQKPFEKYKPPNRKNFLSYSYCLHQFFKILGLPEFSKYFTLLKSYDKLRQQDEIFKKIVAEMALKDKTINWKFYPTI